MTVTRLLFRQFRPVAFSAVVLLVLIEAGNAIALAFVGPTSRSLWLQIGGNATHFWAMAAGIMLIGTFLRQFVTNGSTRREFIVAAATVGVVLVVGIAIVMPLGHGVESAVLGATGGRGSGYPLFTAHAALVEFGKTLVASLAFFVSGGLFAMAFYRFSPAIGLLLLIPAAVPMVSSWTLLGNDIAANVHGLLPYPPAELITVLLAAGGAFALGRATRDVAIRRADA